MAKGEFAKKYATIEKAKDVAPERYDQSELVNQATAEVAEVEKLQPVKKSSGKPQSVGGNRVNIKSSANLPIKSSDRAEKNDLLNAYFNNKKSLKA